MTEHSKTIHYSSDDEDTPEIVITVARATNLMAMKRGVLQFQGSQAAQGNNPDGKPLSLEDEALNILGHLTYPDLVACTVEATGIPWPITLHEFALLPEELANAWETAAYEVNPQWNPSRMVQDRVEQEKKATK